MSEILNFETDVVIVGGGPAGASAAISILLYTDLKVALIENSNLDNLKVGEHVSASIFDLTDYLGIDRKNILEQFSIPSFGSTSYWGSHLPSKNESILNYEGQSYQLDRQQFDLHLIKKVADLGGVVLPRTTCTSYNQQSNGSWKILANHKLNGALSINSKYLVDATGRKSSVSRKLGIRSIKIDKLMGVGTFLKTSAQEYDAHQQMIETTELGWWYTSTLPNNTISATLFTDADIVSKMKLNEPQKWNEALASTKHIIGKLSGMHSKSQKLYIRDASSQINDCSDYTNFIAIGDAAISFDPISSMGIGFAMTSGCHAASLIGSQIRNKDCSSTKEFQNDLNQHFNNYLDTRKKYYGQEKRWLESSFWSRRI